MVGAALKQRDQQYIATRDGKTGTWRILDTWHQSLAEKNPDDDIPDDHESITLVSEGAFLALIKEAGYQGILDSAAGHDGVSYEDYDDIVREKNILEVKLEEIVSEEPTNKGKSEALEISEKKLDTIVKLSQLGELNEKTIDAIMKMGGNSEVKES